MAMFEVDGTFCRCRCHSFVEFHPDGTLRAAYNCPPRYDNALGWAESCDGCSALHWIAATVHDHVTAALADEMEEANSYVAHLQTNKRKHEHD